jgi:anti-sigma regulatory factor (Ser/Thr protein kinase)
MAAPAVSDHASAGSREARTALPGEAASASAARRFVAAELRQAGLDGLADTALLLVSELVANAVLHAHTDLVVVVRVDTERVTVEVHDGVADAPSPKRYSTLSGTGRGLVLVEGLADGWGVEPTHGGKFVWFELARPLADER